MGSVLQEVSFESCSYSANDSSRFGGMDGNPGDNGGSGFVAGEGGW